MKNKLVWVQESLIPYQNALIDHPLYSSLKRKEDIAIFMQQHIFAVWDFMNLLKTIQQQLTCVTVPWLPSDFPDASRFINEIVLEEESDTINGVVTSHFSFYRQALATLSSSPLLIDALLDAFKQGVSYKEAIQIPELPSPIQSFLSVTESCISSSLLETVTAFTFGREVLVPTMFQPIVNQADMMKDEGISLFMTYLNRHIELDGDEHGPLSLEMIRELCGEDDEKWNDVLMIAQFALKQRINLWDEIAQEIKEKKSAYAMA